MKRKIYQIIASKLLAMQNCEASGNHEWRGKHWQAVCDIVNNHFPSGSGFDRGTEICDAESKPDKLVIIANFHHMDENGYYDGWTDHKVIVTPSLAWGFNLRVTGKDRNSVKEYIADTFHHVLGMEIEEHLSA